MLDYWLMAGAFYLLSFFVYIVSRWGHEMLLQEILLAFTLILIAAVAWPLSLVICVVISTNILAE